MEEKKGFFANLKGEKIIGKITASLVILGTFYAMFFAGGAELLTNGVKEVVLIVLGGAITLLFKD